MLIRRSATGDQEALAELYDSTSRCVYGVALRMLGDPMMAEEVTIDVYEQVWRQAASYDLDRDKPLAWCGFGPPPAGLFRAAFLFGA